jgi:hypothetical protein
MARAETRVVKREGTPMPQPQPKPTVISGIAKTGTPPQPPAVPVGP